MRVAFFSDVLASRYGLGLGRYAWELFGALQEAEPALDLLPISAWSNIDRKALVDLQRRYGHQLLPWGRRRVILSWMLFKKPCLETWLRKKVDLVHHVELSYPIATQKPLIVTIHDIGPLTHPEFFSGSHPWLVKAALRQAVNQARALICVSRVTAEEVQEYVGQTLMDRLHVIPEGVASGFFSSSEDFSLSSLPINLNEGWPFILAVGSVNPRKNLIRVVKALEMLSAQIPHHLVLVGVRGWDSDETWQCLHTSSITNRFHFVGFVTDQQLNALYHQADIFVYPSLFEGFGLPVLEAMACGCPVITSVASSLPEIAGDAALLVDPTDVPALVSAILQLAQDSDLRAELVIRGKRRAAAFTWTKCAEQVSAIYECVQRGIG